MESSEHRRSHGVGAIGAATGAIERLLGRKSRFLHPDLANSNSCQGFEFGVDGMGSCFALVQGELAAGGSSSGTKERAVVEADG